MNISHIRNMNESKANHFNKLCVLAGHSIVYAWYQALVDAFAAGATIPEYGSCTRQA